MRDVSTSLVLASQYFWCVRRKPVKSHKLKFASVLYFTENCKFGQCNVKFCSLAIFLCIQNPHRLIAKLNQSLIPSKYVDRSRFGCAPGLISTKSAKLQIQLNSNCDIAAVSTEALCRLKPSNSFVLWFAHKTGLPQGFD